MPLSLLVNEFQFSAGPLLSGNFAPIVVLLRTTISYPVAKNADYLGYPFGCKSIYLNELSILSLI